MRTKCGMKGGCRHEAVTTSARSDPVGVLRENKPLLLLADHP